MKKTEAINLLGGSVSEVAKAIGINPQAVTQWPDELPSRISDRVIAAVAKRDPKNWASAWRQISKPDSEEASHV